MIVIGLSILGPRKATRSSFVFMTNEIYILLMIFKVLDNIDILLLYIYKPNFITIYCYHGIIHY